MSDSTLGRAFMAVSSFSNTGAVYIFDETSFNLLGSIPVGTGNYPTSFSKIVRWGQNGIAVAAPSNNQIYILQSPLVKDVSSSPADLGVWFTAPANGQSLYATIPSSASGITGNSLVAINPFTGAVGTPVADGSQPTVMAETLMGITSMSGSVAPTVSRDST